MSFKHIINRGHIYMGFNFLSYYNRVFLCILILKYTKLLSLKFTQNRFFRQGFIVAFKLMIT